MTEQLKALKEAVEHLAHGNTTISTREDAKAKALAAIDKLLAISSVPEQAPVDQPVEETPPVAEEAAELEADPKPHKKAKHFK